MHHALKGAALFKQVGDPPKDGELALVNQLAERAGVKHQDFRVRAADNHHRSVGAPRRGKGVAGEVRPATSRDDREHARWTDGCGHEGVFGAGDGKSRTPQRLCTSSSCVQATCPRRAGRLHRHPVRFGAIHDQNYGKLPTDSAAKSLSTYSASVLTRVKGGS